MCVIVGFLQVEGKNYTVGILHIYVEMSELFGQYPRTIRLFNTPAYFLYIFDCTKQSRKCVKFNKYEYQKMRHNLLYYLLYWFV